MGLEKISLAMIIAQAQALGLMIEDATRGECADCPCNVCVSMRGLDQATSSVRSS